MLLREWDEEEKTYFAEAKGSSYLDFELHCPELVDAQDPTPPGHTITDPSEPSQ